MPKTFVKQVRGHGNKLYNVHKVVNMIGQVIYEAESVNDRYSGVKRAVTEQELMNMLQRDPDSAYVIKSKVSDAMTKVH